MTPDFNDVFFVNELNLIFQYNKILASEVWCFSVNWKNISCIYLVGFVETVAPNPLTVSGRYVYKKAILLCGLNTFIIISCKLLIQKFKKLIKIKMEILLSDYFF